MLVRSGAGMNGLRPSGSLMTCCWGDKISSWKTSSIARALVIKSNQVKY